MSVIIFVSASKQLFFCRNDVQAIDFLRKGSYAPGSVLIDSWFKKKTQIYTTHWETRYSFIHFRIVLFK